VATLADRAARGTGIVLATQFGRAVLQFASVVVLARLLTPEEFGLVAMVTAIIGIADLLRDFGLSSAAIQSKTLSTDERTNLFWVNLALGAGCMVIVACCTPLITSIYNEPRLAPIVLALSTVFLISGANTQFRADLTRQMRFFALAMSDLIAQFIGVVAAVVAAVAGAGLWAIVLQQVIAALVALVVNFCNIGWLPGAPRRGVSLRRFFRFGGNLLATQTLAYLTMNVDNVAIGAVWGAEPLGLYSRAYKLLMTPLNQINAPMTGVALPVLSRIQDDDETYKRYIGKAQLIACYLTTTVFAVAAGLSVPLVLVLFGPGWTGVAPIFAVLCLGGIFRSVSQIAYWIYLSRGQTEAYLRLVLFTRPIMIAMLLAGLPWGPVGVAVGHSVSWFLYWFVSLVHVGRWAHTDTRMLFANARRAILYVSAPCGVAAYLATFLPVNAGLQVLAGITAATVYLLLAALLVPVVRADARLVLSFARRGLGMGHKAEEARPVATRPSTVPAAVVLAVGDTHSTERHTGAPRGRARTARPVPYGPKHLAHRPARRATG
jgi:PST family polysaccharide transporter